MKIEIKWLKAVCPICGQEYSHKEDYKPQTCGKFACIQELKFGQRFQEAKK